MTSASSSLFQKAKHSIPGGVNSPVRAFKGVGGDPIFIQKGEGAYLTDVDGHTYIDYVGSWGPLILGHAHPQVLEAMTKAMRQGSSFGAPTELEILLAEKIISLMPSIEKVRMVNSGTEATMTAIRLARGFTKKNKILKFNGCYHGHHDALLVKAGSGVLTLGLPASPGIPESVTADTLVVEYNNLQQVEDVFKRYSDEIAAVIVEPIAGNMGFVKPKPEFLIGLREYCTKHQSVLIFDEVMTGFRVALGGAQSIYQIKPDLTTLGKVIGGGMPVGAVGGRDEIMNCLAPSGTVYQAGTLSGNPVAMAAGLETLSQIERPGFFEQLTQTTAALVQALKTVAAKHKRPFCAGSEGGMFGFCFNELDEVCNLNDVAASDEKVFKAFYHGMLSAGVYLAPSMYEAGFVSAAHGQAEIEKTAQAMDAVLGRIIN